MKTEKDNYNPLLSVFVCAYNEETHIKNCLRSLVEAIDQVADKDQIEVFVIDNSSEDRTGDISREFIKDFNNFEYVKIKHCILPISRNSSVLLSNAKYISYIDSDGYVDINWAKNLLKVLISKDPDIISGPVREANKSFENPLYDLYFAPPRQTNTKYLIGANMTFRREYFVESGGAPSIFKWRADEQGILLNLYKKYNNLEHLFSWDIITYNNFSQKLNNFYKEVIQDGINSYSISQISKPVHKHFLNCFYRSTILIWLIFTPFLLMFDLNLFWISILCLFLIKLFHLRVYYINSTAALIKKPNWKKSFFYLSLLPFPFFFDLGFCIGIFKKDKIEIKKGLRIQTPDILTKF